MRRTTGLCLVFGMERNATEATIPSTPIPANTRLRIPKTMTETGRFIGFGPKAARGHRRVPGGHVIRRGIAVKAGSKGVPAAFKTVIVRKGSCQRGVVNLSELIGYRSPAWAVE